VSNTPQQTAIDADDNGIRLDRWFKRHRPEVPHALLSRWTRTGMVRVDGAKTDPAARIATGQILLHPPHDPDVAAHPRAPKERRPLTDAEIAFAEAMVIHQDADAIVFNKEPGLATQGGTGTTAHVDGLLDAFATDRGRPKLVHRLDKDTSGVLLVARSAGSAAKFSRAFAGRSARKTYWAVVAGVPDVFAGQIDLPLAKQPGSGGEKMHVDTENGQAARTRYRVIERAGNAAAFVELQPLTGRTHQLRAHMAAIGHPIIGDGKYGGKAAFLTGSISRKLHLHARRLRIPHPAGGRLDVTAPVPEHFAQSLEALGFAEAMGDAMPQDAGPPPATAEEKKAKARAHAKTLRKERRGERRGRGAAPAKNGAKSKPSKR
jgi:23S rRNA pseudouridine955/2504/2580 synthase